MKTDPGLDIVQYNVIPYLHYMASLYTLTNMVLRTFVSLQKAV